MNGGEKKQKGKISLVKSRSFGAEELPHVLLAQVKSGAKVRHRFVFVSFRRLDRGSLSSSSLSKRRQSKKRTERCDAVQDVHDGVGLSEQRLDTLGAE